MRTYVHTVQEAAGVAALGRLSDRAALAALQSRTGEQSPDHRVALRRARELLDRLREFTGVTVPAVSSLQSMASIGVMDDAYGVVRTQTQGKDVGQFVTTLLAAIDAILNSVASSDEIDAVYGFFDRLAEVTLSRSTQLARPQRDVNLQWTTPAHSFLNS